MVQLLKKVEVGHTDNENHRYLESRSSVLATAAALRKYESSIDDDKLQGDNKGRQQYLEIGLVFSKSAAKSVNLLRQRTLLFTWLDRMFLKHIDLTTALRPSYLPDEVLLFVQDNVGLYEG